MTDRQKPRRESRFTSGPDFERDSGGRAYCAGCGGYVSVPVSTLDGFPICRDCGREWIREVVGRRSPKSL